MPTVFGQSPQVLGGQIRPQFVFAGLNVAPFLRWYNFDGFEFKELSLPSVLPPATVRGIHASRDGKRVAVAHDGVSNNNNLTIYGLDKEKEALAYLGIIPTTHVSNAQCCAWSYDGQFLAVGFNSAPFIRCYRITNAGVVTECSFGTFSGLGNVLSLAWAPDDLKLAVGGVSTDSGGGGLHICTRTSTSATSFTTRVLSSKSTVVESRGVGWLSNQHFVFSATVNDVGSAGSIQFFNQTGTTTFARVGSQPSVNPPATGVQGLSVGVGGSSVCYGIAAEPFLGAYNTSSSPAGFFSARMQGVENTAALIIPRHTATITTPRYSANGEYVFTQAVADGLRVYKSNPNFMWGYINTAPNSVGAVAIGTWPKCEDTVFL